MSEKNEWKPIESAPKDGTEFLACYTRQGNVTQIVKWNTLHGHFASKGEWLPGFTANATHWMPVPAAPGSTSSAPGDAQDERQAFEAWFARRGVWPALCFEEVFIAGWNARPAEAPAAGDALDARRYRWLRDQTETDGIAIVMKDKHFDESSTCAENIDKFIDAALAAQAPQQGEA